MCVYMLFKMALKRKYIHFAVFFVLHQFLVAGFMCKYYKLGIFHEILFSRIGLKDIFATFKLRYKGMIYLYQWERSGSLVECLTRDPRAACSSLTGVTVLCP